jgi:hypothetical protein
VFGILVGYPESSFSTIPDLITTKKRRANKFVVIPWVATHFTKLKNVQKVLSHYTKNFSNFKPKIVIKLSEIWVLDPRSGIRKKIIPDSDQGVKKHRISYPDPQHCPDNVQMADATVSCTIAFF